MGRYAMKHELTEREKKILEEGNSKQIEAMNAQRVIIEQEAIKSGGYPLWLAVEMMTDNLNDRWVLRDELREDAKYGRISLFRKGMRCEEKYRLNPLVLKESDEYIWNNLNDWLKEKYPRIDFKFPPPDAPAAKVGAGAGTSPSGDDDKQRDATGQCYWRAVLNSNIKKMDKPKKASVRGIIKYLRNLNDTRLPNKGNPDELFWIDDMRTEQCVIKKTVSTAASSARKLP